MMQSYKWHILHRLANTFAKTEEMADTVSKMAYSVSMKLYDKRDGYRRK